MKKPQMLEALAALDSKLGDPLTLLIGGGAAMILAHGVPLSTHDIDGQPLDSKLAPAEVYRLALEVGQEMALGGQWYNDYFNAFTYALPKDFRDRLVEVYRGKNLTVKALGASDLLIMKCMAGREKDIGHARALIKRGADLKVVEAHLEALAEKNLPGAKEAAEFLEELMLEAEGA